MSGPLRQAWRDFVCSPNHAGRYLFPGGAFAEPTQPISNAVVADFLQRLTDAEVEVPMLALLYYLLQPRVREFFQEHLPELVRSASHVTTGTIEVSRRGVRGKVMWPETIRLRQTGMADASTFLLRKTRTSSDVPENRLLRLFLSDVSDGIAATAKLLGTTEVLPELLEVKDLADRALREPYLREVQKVRKADSLMVQRAFRHRNWRYGELAELQIQMEEALREDYWETILRLLYQGWLEPINEDDLFELYSLVLVLDVLRVEASFGEPVGYGLVRRNRHEVATFYRQEDDVKIDVYFDQSPTQVFACASEYKQIVGSYDGISGSSHRPDITLRIRRPGGPERYLFIESKNAQTDEYKRDSVYKVLGYLYDFRELWHSVPDQPIKAVLLFPIGITPQDGSSIRQVVLASASDRKWFSEIIKQVI